MPQPHSTTSKRTFKHLSFAQRAQIQGFLKAGIAKSQIVKLVGISRSTLYNELKRGTVTQLSSQLVPFKAYFADTGQLVYQQHRQACRKPYKLAPAHAFLQYLEYQILEHKLSADTICGAVKSLGIFPCVVSTKTVYNYIALGLLRVKNIDLLLRVKRKNKSHRLRQDCRILGESIENRPIQANVRSQFGHWESIRLSANAQKGRSC